MYRSNAYKCEYNKPKACKIIFLSLKKVNSNTYIYIYTCMRLLVLSSI